METLNNAGGLHNYHKWYIKLEYKFDVFLIPSFSPTIVLLLYFCMPFEGFPLLREINRCTVKINFISSSDSRWKKRMYLIYFILPFTDVKICQVSLSYLCCVQYKLKVKRLLKEVHWIQRWNLWKGNSTPVGLPGSSWTSGSLLTCSSAANTWLVRPLEYT